MRKGRLKVGDQLTVKSFEWYNHFKDKKNDYVRNSITAFVKDMSNYCGQEARITSFNEQDPRMFCIDLDNGEWDWTEDMFEDDDYVYPIKFGNSYLIYDRRIRSTVNTEFYPTLEEAENEIQNWR